MHDLFKAIVDDFAALPAKVAAAQAASHAMSKPTPGPWIAVECNSFNCELQITTQARVDLGLAAICDIDIDYDGEFGVEQQANAKLIAAAPELRKELEDAADMFCEIAKECANCNYGHGATGKSSDEGDCEECAPIREAERRARAVIDKATRIGSKS